MSTERRLSDEQERLRLDGLRALARIIARHVLAHPDLYLEAPGAEQQAPPIRARTDANPDPTQKDGEA